MSKKQIIKVYEAVVDGARTSLDVSANTNLSVKVSSAWLSELGRAGMIEKSGKVKYPGTSRKAFTWKLSTKE